MLFRDTGYNLLSAPGFNIPESFSTAFSLPPYKNNIFVAQITINFCMREKSYWWSRRRSHTSLAYLHGALVNAGCDVVIVDNLSNSDLNAPSKACAKITGVDIPFVEVDCCDRGFHKIFRTIQRVRLGDPLRGIESRGRIGQKPLRILRQ